MAAYGAQLKAGKSRSRAKSTWDLFKNVPVQDKSAREALQTVHGGKGDVLLAYENEAITAQQKGEELDYVVPNGTILIQNPIAVTIERADRRRRRSSTSRAATRRRRSSARRATARRNEPRGQVQVPDAAEPVHDRRPRRLAR